MAAPDVAPARGRRDTEAFVALPSALHRGTPGFTPMLRRDARVLLDPARHPFYEHADRVTLPAPLVRGLLGVAGGLARAWGGAPLLDGDKARELLAPGWSGSSEALRRDTGWRAEMPLERGLRETACAWREAGWL